MQWDGAVCLVGWLVGIVCMYVSLRFSKRVGSIESFHGGQAHTLLLVNKQTRFFFGIFCAMCVLSALQRSGTAAEVVAE